jgi:hypothetical protein
MVGQKIEEITADKRTSSYDKAAWILFIALIAVVPAIFRSPSIAAHFVSGQAGIDNMESQILLGALVAEIIIFLFSCIVLARKPCHKYKFTWAVAMLTGCGCIWLGALTLVCLAMADMHNC